MDRPVYTLVDLIREMRRWGIEDKRLLAAVKRVPRARFVEEEHQHLAYCDQPLYIGLGQVITKPSLTARLLQAVGFGGAERSLEIGTGSGYQTALMAELARSVVSIERHSSLAELARQRLDALAYRNVAIHVADGSVGWPSEAPYDVIVVSGGAPDVPAPLLEQLAEGGRLIVPVGPRDAQELVLVRREGDSFRHENLKGGVHFVPLVGESGWEESEG